MQAKDLRCVIGEGQTALLQCGHLCLMERGLENFERYLRKKDRERVAVYPHRLLKNASLLGA